MGVVFQDGTILTAAQLNSAMQQKVDTVNPVFQSPIALPGGPTSGRPTAPVNFTVRGNSDTNVPEAYINGQWVQFNLGNVPGNAPTAPTSLIVGTVSSNAIPVSWAASTGAATINYQPQYRISGSTSWTNWGGPSTALSATITGLTPATNYDIQVVASNSYGSATSATVSTKTLAIPPNSPTNLQVGSATNSSLTATWKASTQGDPAPNYQVSYAASGTTSYTNFNSAVSGTSEIITGLSASTTYNIKVTAQNPAGSAVVGPVSGTTAAPGAAPNAPTNLLASNIQQNQLDLSWTASSVGDSPVYTIFGKKHTDSSFTQLPGGGTAVSVTVTGLNPGLQYDFYVQASNSTGKAQSTTYTAPATLVPANGGTGTVWGTQYSQLGTIYLTAPYQGQVATGATLDIKGCSVTDPSMQSSTANCTLSISTQKGGGNVSSTDSSGNPISGSGTGTISGYKALLQGINTALSNLVYTAPSAAESDAINITFTDANNVQTQLSIPITVVASSSPSLPWGQSSLAGPGSIATDSSGTQATRVYDVLHSFGVNSRIDVSNTPYYNNITSIENAINYLGITILRDSPNPSESSDTTWYPQIKNNVSVIGGLRYWLYISQQAQSGFQPQLTFFEQMAASGYVMAFENEESADFASDGVAAAENFQPTLYSGAQSSSVKAATFTVSNSNASSVPDQSANTDYGSVVAYMAGTPFDSNFQAYLNSNAKIIAASKPAALTEYGWQSFAEGGSSQGNYGYASVNACAAYSLTTMFDAFKLGFSYFFWYQLCDGPNDQNGATTYGLFDASWNAKPAATAIRNMNLLVMDQGAAASTFTTGKLNFSLSVPDVGNNALGMHSMLLQRSDGAFFIVLYNEQELQDLSNYPNQTNAEITVNPVANTITLGTSATNIAVYDPLQGTTAVQTGSGTSITVQVPAHPIFVEVVRP